MDRISNLPDELLGHILSSLTTKEAVSTCVLSKRWEDVWVNVYNLDFYIPCGSPDGYLLLDSDLKLDSIDEVLCRLKSTEIRRFQLYCKRMVHPGVIARLINHAIRLNAYEIDFNIFRMELPLSFFKCDRFTVLRLCSTSSDSMTIPEVFCFPNLKSLEFRVGNPPKELTKNIFRSCPKLEYLAIGGIICKSEQVIYDVSSLSLRILDINVHSKWNYESPPKVFLNVPNIERLHIVNEFDMEFEVQGSLAPIDASITVRCCCQRVVTEENGNCAYILLKGICGVRSLVLKEATTFVLSKYYINNLPTLQHLTCLDVGIPRLCSWIFLFSVLENSPNLQVLTVRKACSHYEFVSPIKHYLVPKLPGDFDWTEPHTPPNCLQSHLENIKFVGFFWMKCDMKAMKYLLCNGRVLKEVTFNPYTTELKGEPAFWVELVEYARLHLHPAVGFRLKMMKHSSDFKK